MLRHQRLSRMLLLLQDLESLLLQLLLRGGVVRI
jgi:hypothetical protein